MDHVSQNPGIAAFQLKEITEEILSGDRRKEALESSVGRLYSLFSELTELDDDSNRLDDTHNTLLADGEAISPKIATRCMHDSARTAQYLRGVHEAVREAQRRFPNERLDVLYAGCGPFAPLAIPLMTQFAAQEIQFTLLDIHRRSLDASQQIIATLGLGDFVRDYVQTDATTYKHPADRKLHMVITETMQTALLVEPQFAIALNLTPQICHGGILVPERVTIDACLQNLTYKPHPSSRKDGPLFSAEARGELARINLGRIAALTLDSCCDSASKVRTDSSGERWLPAGTVETPDEANEDFYLTLLTGITTFGQFKLGEYESLLTYPIVMHDLGKIHPGMKIEFYYQFGAKPRFKCRLMSNLSEARPSGRA